VRLGGVDGQSRAQLDGFKSRALRPEAPAQRHLYATEWRVLAATPAPAQGRPAALVLGDAALPFEDERVPSRTRWNELELDLEPGILRLKVGGGLAGHNGLKSISAHLHTDDYVRVRIGVGKPSSKDVGADHVLSSIPAAERRILDVAVEVAVDSIESIISGGIAAAMQDFNGR
jgi:hypothetical protein